MIRPNGRTRMETLMAMTHETIEKNTPLLMVLIILAIIWGGLVEIVPLWFQRSTTQPVDGLKPYSAVQLIGRDIYVREGCYNCHSQMVRPFRAETLRYGHYSMAGEFVRTPKKGSREGRYRARAALPTTEVALSCLSFLSVVASIRTGHWFATPFAMLFTFGYGYVALLVASEQAQRRRESIEDSSSEPASSRGTAVAADGPGVAASASRRSVSLSVMPVAPTARFHAPRTNALSAGLRDGRPSRQRAGERFRSFG